MTKNKTKAFLHKVHLWLGLTTGLIVLLLSISGALYAFRDELFELLKHDYIHLKEDGKKLLPVAELWKTAQKNASDGVEYQHLVKSNDPLKSWCFIGYHDNHNSWHYFANIDYYENIYINPYTGTVIGKIDMKYEFFELVKGFHYSFWLTKEIGQQLTGWSVFVFFLSLLTGIYLWVKSKNPLRKKLTVKWKSGTKRVNFDLHNTIGIYASVFGLVFSFTGLVIAFQWFMSIVYVVVNMSITPPSEMIVNSKEEGFEQQMSQIQKIYDHAATHFPSATSITFSLPHHKEELEEPCELYIRYNETVRYDASMAKYDWNRHITS